MFSLSFERFLVSHGVDIKKSGVNAHFQNGVVERLHREVNEMLVVLKDQHESSNWVQLVSIIAWKHNIAANKNGKSPYLLVFGREARTTLGEEVNATKFSLEDLSTEETSRI